MTIRVPVPALGAPPNYRAGQQVIEFNAEMASP